MQKRKIYFLFDFPNISRSWASLRGFELLNELIDWRELKRCLKQHAHDNYPGVLNLEFVVFINRRSARESKGRIHHFRSLGYKTFVRRKETKNSDIDDDIVRFIYVAVRDPETSAVYVIGNDLRNASDIADMMETPLCEDTEGGSMYLTYNGEADLWVGIMPSAMSPNTFVDRFPPNTQILNLEKFLGVFS